MTVEDKPQPGSGGARAPEETAEVVVPVAPAVGVVPEDEPVAAPPAEPEAPVAEGAAPSPAPAQPGAGTPPTEH